MVTTGGIHGVFVGLPGPARAGRRGAGARSGVAAGAGQHRSRRARCRCRIRCTSRAAGGRTSRRCARLDHAEDARDLRELAEQPDRRRADARGSRGDRRARAGARPLGDLRRSLRGRASSTASEHISIASLPGMYERTIPLYTFSKTYAMTGLRLAYIAVHDRDIRDRVRKVLFYTVSNTSSLIQYGGVGALEGSQAVVDEFRQRARGAARSVLRRASARPPRGVLQRHAAGRRVLRVPQDRSVLAIAAAGRAGVAVVGDDGVPDQARPHRLRAGRRLRPGRAKATCASASRATAPSSPARSTRCRRSSRSSHQT